MHSHTYPSTHLHCQQHTSHTTGKEYEGPPSKYPTAEDWSKGLDPKKGRSKDLDFVRTLWDENWRWFQKTNEQWHEHRPHSVQRACTIPHFATIEEAIKNSENEDLASAEAAFKEWWKATPGAGARYPPSAYTARRCMVEGCALVACYQGICTKHLAEGAHFFLVPIACSLHSSHPPYGAFCWYCRS